MTPLPPEELLASPWAPCPQCGTMRLADSDARCQRCSWRPQRQDLILGAGGPPKILNGVLLETWFAAVNFAYVNTGVDFGTLTTVDGTAADLKDGTSSSGTNAETAASDLTCDSFSMVGTDPVQEPRGVRTVTFNLGSPIQHFQVVTVDTVRVSLRAELSGDPGSTSVIRVQAFGGNLPGGGPPDDDYLAAPIGQLAWTTNDYLLSSSGILSGRTRAELLAATWGFEYQYFGFTAGSTNTIVVPEFRVQFIGSGFQA